MPGGIAWESGHVHCHREQCTEIPVDCEVLQLVVMGFSNLFTKYTVHVTPAIILVSSP